MTTIASHEHGKQVRGCKSVPLNVQLLYRCLFKQDKAEMGKTESKRNAAVANGGISHHGKHVRDLQSLTGAC